LPQPVEAHRVRRAAATILGEMGTNAAAAVPALRQALADPDDGVQASASYALRVIQPPPTIAIIPGTLSLEAPRRRTQNDSNDFGVRLEPVGSRSVRSIRSLNQNNSPARP
jgi:hypothetical protein